MTYNWGAIEWALANTIAPLCRHIHLEDGFGLDEADRQLRRRVVFRRLALARTTRLVVPSENLREIATASWKIRLERVAHIPNGIEVSRFQAPPGPRAIAGPEAALHDLVIGTVAPLRAEKNLDLLLHIFAGLVGDGPERGRLANLAETLGLGARVTFAGHVDAVEQVLPSIDVFAMTSKTEQMPISLLQAMAAGRAVVATDVGDVKTMLAPENRAFVAPKDDGERFGGHLARLLDDPGLRAELGTCNRNYVRAHYAMGPMLKAYERLLEEVVDRE
jgi:glycosyltransferase involved in cell wall biosynthesis